MDNSKKMKWQKDLETYFDLYNSFILEGSIDDDQPYENESGQIEYCRLYDYFDKVYSNHADIGQRKRVIIYDPTESEDKRFKICDRSGRMVEERDEPDSEPKKVMQYDSTMSQHFWNIANDDEVAPLLIDHKSSGFSLDFAKIHYALTEHTDRLAFFNRLQKFTDELRAIFSAAGSEPNGYLIVMKMTSRLLNVDGASQSLNPEELMLFRQLLNVVQSMDAGNLAQNRQNKLVILANQIGDLPEWFADEMKNPFIKVINVSLPSEEYKLDFFHEMLADPDCFSPQFIERYRETETAFKETNPQGKNPVEKKFLAYTNEFSVKMLRRYRGYAAKNRFDDPGKLGFSISAFRVGDLTNPWDDEQRIKEMLKIKESIEKKILGQDHALQAAQDILARAAIGLDRSENPNAPRVILFLAGPTGTGKTELCKQIAECIFGSEDRIVRFDMSEYGQEESDQKLFGAPPGYIGYSEGGKLTNAVKKEPFSLVLFDEIEKAHNSILDKFLQILGDGRLTDGKGETVRFTDCIIVITSNAGVFSFDGLSQPEIDKLMNGDKKPQNDVEMNMERVVELENEKAVGGNLSGESLDEIYKEVKEHLRYNVKSYFHCKLKRPELYGRIEDSIVYYNYISRPAVKNIVRSKMKGVVKAAKEAMAIRDIVCSDALVDGLVQFCQDCKVRALGARGIIKSTGKLFTGSLSNFLSEYVRGVNGKSRSQLAGKRLSCDFKGGGDITSNDIVWSVLND